MLVARERKRSSRDSRGLISLGGSKNVAQQKRLPKTKRAPEAIAPKRITERSLDVVRAIARYRFIPTSTLLRIVGGNEDVTHRHLQHLYHAGVISRFTIPNTTHRGEFIYFLDNLITV